MDTFIKAYEGLERIKNIISPVDYCFSEEYRKEANEIIRVYWQFHEGLPFPLVAVEDDLKYAVLGTLIQDVTGNKLYLAKQGLLFPLENGTALKLQSSYWAIVDIDEEEYQENFSIMDFEEDSSYEEFCWVYRNYREGNSCEDYYQYFLPEFMEACLNEEMILQFEMDNMLLFGVLPERKEIDKNCLVYCDVTPEQLLRVKLTERGARKVKEKGQYIYENGELRLKENRKPLYDFDIEIEDKTERSPNKERLISLYAHIVGYTSLNNLERPSGVKGVIVNDKVVYELGNHVFCVDFSGKLQEAIQIAYGAKIYSYDGNNVYLEKEDAIDNNLIKHQVFSYNSLTNDVKLVKIDFKRQVNSY